MSAMPRTERESLPLPPTVAAATLPPRGAQDDTLSLALAALDPTHAQRVQLLAQLAEALLQIDDIEQDLRHFGDSRLAGQLIRLDAQRASMAALAQQVARDTREDHARQERLRLHLRAALVAEREAAAAVPAAAETH
ncbi:MAG: hypothetical protein RL456_238 [Pseudomonadota bacterium]